MKGMKRGLRVPNWRGLSAGAALLAVGLGVLVWPGLVGGGPLLPGQAGPPPAAGVGAQAVQAIVVEDAPEHIVIDYQLGDFTQTSVLIGGQNYTKIALGTESVMKEVVGAPELPSVCRSIIIPDDAKMEARVLASRYYEIADIDVAPSRGFILRTVNPADVPHTFGKAYDIDGYYPGALVSLRDPYILRDHRGLVVELFPFQYNPVARTLRVYTSVTVEVVKTGPGQINVLQQRDRELSLAFHQVYSHHFLNYHPGLRYTPLDETGDMLIIYHDAWQANVQPLVDHKNAIGINTTAVGVSAIPGGSTATAIGDYIQDAYDTGDLAFVLLVGDAAQVATPFASGGSADPTYALVAGGDSYPDIFVGRFSAETSAQVDTQVLRTIEYEQLPATGQDWFKRGTGIASAEGAGIGDDGEADWQHLDNIRTDLLAYGYTVVDQIYDPGATASQVSTAVNAGRGIINYCGHGSTYAWSTTGFSTSHIDSLVNDNMLPFIFDVACVNGQFDGFTCFAEAWMRATNGSEPTGAIGIYASSINQSWAPPMCAQDEGVDLLVAEAYFSFGALCFAGSCQMMDEYGSGGVSMFNTWHVFGDPSLRVFGEPVETCDDGILNQDEERIDCGGTVCPPCDCLSDGECDDGQFCTGAETCDAYGHCQTGSDPCPGQLCDEGSGTCIDCFSDPDCDDGLYCNGAETCVGGACQAGTSVDCTDGVACTDDTCNEGTESCDSVANDANCDNALYCDGTETCDAVLDCQAGTPIDCDDAIVCTVDSCNEATDSCDNIPDDALCDDGLFCTGVETCDAVSGCLPGGGADCDDAVSCTVDSCNETTDSCDNVPDDAMCDNGLFCDGAETCDAVQDCQGGTDPCPGEDCDEVNDVCVPIVCNGDGTCDPGEDCNNCPSDCISGGEGGICGNGICEPDIGEDCLSCPADCNGKQVGTTKRQFCCGDGDGTNPVDCGDPRCSEDGFACSDVPPDPYCCGDLICEGAEDSLNCEVDCGSPPFCGDGTCDPDEDQCNCPADCGTPPASETDCGDGVDDDCDGLADCEDTEDCADDPVCQCLPRDEPCTLDGECCSGWCHKGVCK